MKSIFTSLLLSTTIAAAVNAQTPFAINVRNYTYIGKAGLNANTADPIKLFTTTNPAAANGGFNLAGAQTVTFAAGTTAANNLNGTGISVTDGFMYGMEYKYSGPFANTGAMYRIGSDAVAQMVGVIPPPSQVDAGRAVLQSFINSASGTMDAGGNYWFTAYSFTDFNMPFSGSKVDVFLGRVGNPAGISGTGALDVKYYHLDISDPTLQTGYKNFMSSAFAHFVASGYQFSAISNTNGGWQDMDLNPANGQFYSYIAFPSTETASPTDPEPPLNSYLVRIDTLKNSNYWGKVSLINTTANANPNTEEDGAYFDASGNYYTLFTDGTYTQTDIATGIPGTLTATGLPLNNGQMRGDLATNTPVVPLPVKLISFSGTIAQSGVTLNWKIADWQELSDLDIQRSADGREFNTLSTIKVIGEQDLYRDQAPLSIGYYRLRMKESNGKITYSPIIRMSTDKETMVSAYPNPVIDQLTIHAEVPTVSIRLTDVNGRIVNTGNYHVEGGIFSLSLSNLPVGSYLLTVIDADNGKRLLSQMIQKF